MKKIKLYLSALIVSGAFLGCDGEEEAEVIQNIDIAGVAINVEGSGALQGEPDDMDNLSDSNVNILTTELDMTIISASEEDLGAVSHFEVVKQFNGGDEISLGTYESLPFSVNLTELSQFLENTSVSEDDLRIGDLFTFKVRVHQNDGDSYQYLGQAFNLAVNCFADLSGTYSVTNSVCGTGSSGTIPPINITQTPDGNWKLDTADGGLLQYCSSNTSLVNGGTISVICGEVMPASPDFCGSNGIGCITGGTWDQETGVLVLELNDTFFGHGDYTATYTLN